LVSQFSKSDPNQFEQWSENLRILIPQVGVIETHEDTKGALELSITMKNGLRVFAPFLSSGTLRLMAITILPYLDRQSGTLLLDEPEDAIHPPNIDAVYLALKSMYGVQVVATTHSPALLSLAKPTEVLWMKMDEQGQSNCTWADQHWLLEDWEGEPDLGTLVQYQMVPGTRA